MKLPSVHTAVQLEIWPCTISLIRTLTVWFILNHAKQWTFPFRLLPVHSLLTVCTSFSIWNFPQSTAKDTYRIVSCSVWLVACHRPTLYRTAQLRWSYRSWTITCESFHESITSIHSIAAWFLPCNCEAYARSCYRHSVCLSVCLSVSPSVKRVDCDKTR